MISLRCLFGRHRASRDLELKVMKEYLETGWYWDSGRCIRCGHMIGVFLDETELTLDVLENLNGYNGLETLKHTCRQCGFVIPYLDDTGLTKLWCPSCLYKNPIERL
jgi:hypothetical protein